MITTPQEYNDLLYRIQSDYAPRQVLLLPSSERIYEINLNTRVVEAPEFLSVAHDHRAETLYFVVDRFFDPYDLYQATCVVEYINAAGEHYLYPVPFVDIETLNKWNVDEETFINKMIIPWNIGGSVTAYPGDVTFAFRFYHIDPESITQTVVDETTGELVEVHGETKFLYNLSTLPQKSKVLYGIGADVLEEEYEIFLPGNELKNVYQKLDEISKKAVYWLDVDT